MAKKKAKKTKKRKKRAKARPKKKAKKRVKKARPKKKAKKARPKKRAKKARPKKKAKPKAKAKKVVKEVEIGKVTHYYGHIEVGIVKLKKSIKKGDKLHFKGATSDFKQAVGSMQVNHSDIEVGKVGDEIGLKVNKKVREGDTVYFAK